MMNDLPVAALPMQSDSFTVPFENVVRFLPHGMQSFLPFEG